MVCYKAFVERREIEMIISVILIRFLDKYYKHNINTRSISKVYDSNFRA